MFRPPIVTIFREVISKDMLQRASKPIYKYKLISFKYKVYTYVKISKNDKCIGAKLRE